MLEKAGSIKNRCARPRGREEWTLTVSPKLVFAPIGYTVPLNRDPFSVVNVAANDWIRARIACYGQNRNFKCIRDKLMVNRDSRASVNTVQRNATNGSDSAQGEYTRGGGSE